LERGHSSRLDDSTDNGVSSMNKYSCSPLPSRATFTTGARNTKKLACKLHDSELFSRPKFSNASQWSVAGYGLDGQNGNAWRTTNFVFRTSSPPIDRRKSVCGFQSQLGAKTMTTESAIPTPTAATSPIARQQAIENALSMALHYVRNTDNKQGIQAATSKAIRAVSMLKQACAEVAA
jgi:hypothetical protein